MMLMLLFVSIVFGLVPAMRVDLINFGNLKFFCKQTILRKTPSGEERLFLGEGLNYI
jgi:hypothetical protein